MPRANFFAQLGWFVLPQFFDEDTCARLRREMASSPCQPDSILDDKNQLVVDADKRRTDAATVSSETSALVTTRLIEAMPALEKHFDMRLIGCEPVSFLVYKPGAFFGRHADANHSTDAPAKFRQRKVSVSIFLNGESEQDSSDAYSGGTLSFSGARGGERQSKHAGIGLTGEEGLLIGFNSSLLHEIQPVRRGVRYSIVTWFF